MPISYTEPIYFGSNNLLSISGITITGYDTFRYPDKSLQAFNKASANEAVSASNFLGGRAFNIRGVFALSSKELLDDSISHLFLMTSLINQELKFPYQGTQHLLKNVSVKNIAIKDAKGGYCEFDIEMLAAKPYVYALTTTSLLSVANLTSGIKSYPITVSGRARQLPIITFTLDSFTGTGNREISFINPVDSTSITIERTWTATDVVVVNCEEKTVVLNGTTDVEFTGNFLEYNTGAGFINYEDNFTARQVDISVDYYKRYL